MSFIAELKRRNVIRAAAFYAASAWLLVQVATQVFPFFHIAEWVVRWIVIAAIIGFPFAMLFSWFYEWTPQGIQRESEVEPNASITREMGKKLDRWIIAVLSVAVVLLLANTFVLHKDESVATIAQAPGKSVAVLPFENLSDDKGNVFFSDGITEEILDALAQIPDLKVAARSSAFQFKGNNLDLHKVGQELGVANILEGSVQKAGDQVRINVQMVDAQTGLQVWSEKYDRKFDNVFAVEDDIAKSIATRLRVQLTGGGGQSLVAVGTTNPQAHTLYLQGLTLIAVRGPGLREAADDFQQAVKLDPGYAQAWGGWAEAEGLFPAYGLDSLEDAMPRAESMAQHALKLDPNTPSAYVTLGEVYAYRFQWQQADAAFRHALTLAPGDSEAVNQYAQFLTVTGQLEAALREIEHAQQLDPLSPIIGNVRAGILMDLRRDDAAKAQSDSILAAHPDLLPGNVFLFLLDVHLKHYQDAEMHQRAIARFLGVDADAKALVARGIGDPAQRSAALQSLDYAAANADVRGDLLSYAFYLMLLDEPARAQDQLDIFAARRNTDFGMFLWDRSFDPLRSTPRFKAMLTKIGLPYPPATGAVP